MVDEEHRGTGRRVLLAGHLDANVAQPATKAAEHRCGDVHPGAPVLGQYAGHETAAQSGGEPAEQTGGTQHGQRIELALLLVQSDSCPTFFSGVSSQLGSGVNRMRMAHAAEEWHVLVAIGIGMASAQSEAAALREITDRRQLAVSPRRTPDDPSGDDPVPEFELRAQDVLDSQLTRHRGHLQPGRGRGDHNGMALILVGPDKSPCPVKQRTGNVLGEQLVSEFVQFLFGSAHPSPDTLQQKVFEGGLVQGATGGGPKRPENLVGAQLEVAGPMGQECAGRVALDQGPVEVEECRHFRTTRSGLDLLDELIDGRHRCAVNHVHSRPRRQ